MLKKIVIIILLSFLIVGCEKETDDQMDKDEYLAWKSDLVEQDTFSTNEEITCDITVSVDRIDEEVISYTTVVSNITEDMNQVKMMVVHNYFTEELFPTVGIFDEGRDLLVENGDKITLVGYIDTTKDISDLGLELRIWIEYIDNDGNVKDIYYKTTK